MYALQKIYTVFIFKQILIFLIDLRDKCYEINDNMPSQNRNGHVYIRLTLERFSIRSATIVKVKAEQVE